MALSRLPTLGCDPRRASGNLRPNRCHRPPGREAKCAPRSMSRMAPPVRCSSSARSDTPRPGPGEVRVKLATSGVNPSDVKARSGATRKIAYPRVIPHSDGAGEIDMVGDSVSPSRLGERVWVWNAQWVRAFGTCAEYVALPSPQAVRLPANTSFEVGACLGIPAMTAYHAIAVSGAAPGMTLLDRRRRRRRRSLCRAVRQDCGRHCHYYRQFAAKGGCGARRRRRPHHRL